MAEQASPERGEDERETKAHERWWDAMWGDCRFHGYDESLLSWLERARRARAREKVLVERLEAAEAVCRAIPANILEPHRVVFLPEHDVGTKEYLNLAARVKAWRELSGSAALASVEVKP